VESFAKTDSEICPFLTKQATIAIDLNSPDLTSLCNIILWYYVPVLQELWKGRPGTCNLWL